jgi:hypothetical protein
LSAAIPRTRSRVADAGRAPPSTSSVLRLFKPTFSTAVLRRDISLYSWLARVIGDRGPRDRKEFVRLAPEACIRCSSRSALCREAVVEQRP